MKRVSIAAVAFVGFWLVCLWTFRSSNVGLFPVPPMSHRQNHNNVNSHNIKGFSEMSAEVQESRSAFKLGNSVTKRTEKGHVILITNGTVLHTAFKDGIQDCPQLPPNVKCNLSYASHEVWNQSDAIVFRAFHVDQASDLWDYHREGQKWIFEEHESPMKTWNPVRRENFDALWDQFNITILYTKDASIQFYMYSIKCKLRPEDENVKLANEDYLRGKERSVLWMVGNCNWTMGRELYVDELMKYIDVDIFGACGDHVVCGNYEDGQTNCIEHLMNKYKYFLSFENSFCEGYYTEKAIKAHRAMTIPVVMGLVNYTELLTPGTFIDVRDYKSPKLLAEYLKMVGSDPKLYNGYINRKRRTECSSSSKDDYLCQLCQYLYEHEGQTEILPNMREYWGREKRCMSPDKFFKGVADDIIPRFTKKRLF
ncbi:hypothetical protein CAPTEDRAFT_200121 [Capitella teleta]|uniref:Fucosyltransferase n=1 Tax=Capitella teleta TaxID=283909 RepID=R7V2H8_CAPTE|nr:hypothetical protein CAPTEDRAFT_200121 [Capitella teleta]|eukprot:ELU13063.1 hypothetical protein CAPTEDRAFT_200121 [Capitella teleta]